MTRSYSGNKYRKGSRVIRYCILIFDFVPDFRGERHRTEQLFFFFPPISIVAVIISQHNSRYGVCKQKILLYCRARDRKDFRFWQETGSEKGEKL